MHGVHVVTHECNVLLNPLQYSDMAHIHPFKLVQVVNDLAERDTLEVQIQGDRDCVRVRPHVLEPLSLGVPSVATGYALEPLNLGAVLAVLPAPLLNMRRAAVRALFLIWASDLKCEVEVLRGNMLTEIEREIHGLDVLAGDLSVSEVWALASPVHALTDDQVRAVSRLRVNSVSVLVDALDLVPV